LRIHTWNDPAVVTENIIAVTTFRDRAGKELGSIRQSEMVSVWMQLLLIFAMPFREEPNQLQEAYITI